MRPQDPELARLLDGRFVPVRLTSLKGVDLNTFAFDYDQTLMGIGLTPGGETLFRWTARDDEPGAIAGLVDLLRSPWPLTPGKRTLPKPVRTLADNPRFAATKRAGEACYHCHYAHDAWVADLKAAGKLDKTLLYRYPPVENVGVRLKSSASSTAAAVTLDSPAARAGVQAGDRLVSVNGKAVHTDADIRFALDTATDRLELAWLRGEKVLSGRATLPNGWRVYDISDRPSQGGVGPILGIWEEKLPADRRAALGLKPDQMALRVSFMFDGAKWVATRGGLEMNDVIVAVDGKTLPDFSARQFHTWFRMNQSVGKPATVTVLRGGVKKDIVVPCLPTEFDE